MYVDYKEAWEELKSRLENFLWALENSKTIDGKIDNEQRIKDTKGILNKMESFEKEIRNQKH